MHRRAFIKLTAIGGGTATLAGCGNPEHQLIRFIPDEELVPGVAQWKPGICPACAAGCGLQVRVMESDAEVVRNGQAGIVRMNVAKKLEGNPAYPINRGGLCPRGQAAIQITYHPDRIGSPRKRVGPRGSGQFESVTWDVAIGELVARLDALAATAQQRALAFLTIRRPGTRFDVVSRFLRGFGAPPPVVFEAFPDDVLRLANARSFGRDQLPTFDLARSRFVIGFGADFLGTWNSPVAHSQAFGLMRQGRPGIRGRFVQVEPRLSQTGANADEWMPIRPGTEGVVALGLAHVIIAERLRARADAGLAGAQIDGWSEGLPQFGPHEVERITGIAAGRVERLARDFAQSDPAVAIIGGAPLAQTNGLFHALAVNALNALVDAVEGPGGVAFTPAVEPLHARSIRELLDEEPPIVFLDGANPVFGTPAAWRVREWLERSPFIASFGSFLDETSALADLVLPDHSFLESWVDAAPESGSAVPLRGIAAPAMRPLHQTRGTPDVLLEVARRLQRPLTGDLPWENFTEAVQAALGAVPGAPHGDEGWERVQDQGGWWREDNPPPQPARRPRANARVGLRTEPVRFAEPQSDGDPADFPFGFLPYPSQAFFDGSLAHLPWLQELPDPLTSAMWSSWVEINASAARRLGIAQGDVVEVASRHGSLRAPAILSPGIAPDLVAMPVGQGHTSFTRVATGRGANPIALLAPVTEAATGTLAWAATRVRITRVAGQDGRLILFAGEAREHPDRGR
jgi:menaquinone reductase, molybdopterin-binding-like subunit